MKSILKYLYNRLFEGSSWVSLLVLILGATGHNVSETQANEIVSLLTQLVGAAGFLLPENLKEKVTNLINEAKK